MAGEGGQKEGKSDGISGGHKQKMLSHTGDKHCLHQLQTSHAEPLINDNSPHKPLVSLWRTSPLMPRLRVSCVATPSVGKVSAIVRKQLSLPEETQATGEMKFGKLVADSFDTVVGVKKSIEILQGAYVYYPSQQMLIHQGKVLKDATTLGENDVAENSFLVILLSKLHTTTTSAPVAVVPVLAAPQQKEADGYGQTASNLVAGSNLETIQQILDMGGESWDWDTIVCALRDVFINPERAMESLLSGIPEQTGLPIVVQITAAPPEWKACRPLAQAPPPAAVVWF